MADITKRYLDLTGLTTFWGKVKDFVAANYDVKGAADEALSSAKTYADGLNTAMDTRVAAMEGKVEAWDAAEANAKAYTDEKVETIESAAEALEVRVKANEDAVAAHQTALDTLNGAETVEGSVKYEVAAGINDFATKISDDSTVNTFKELVDYAASHTSEYSELAGEVQKNTEAIATLNGSEAGSVAYAVAQEAARAEAAEQANAEAISAIQADYLKAADKTELQGSITANADAIEAIETSLGENTSDKSVVERIAQLEGMVGIEDGEAGEDASLSTQVAANTAALATLNGTGAGSVSKTVSDAVDAAVSELKGDVAETYDTLGKLEDAVQANAANITSNAEAISAIQADYLKAADKAELQGSIDAVAEAVEAINSEESGILAEAKAYTDEQIATIGAIETSSIEALFE